LHRVNANEKLLRLVIEARIAGDRERLAELMHPDLMIHFPGSSRLAGDHRGPGALNAKAIEITGNPLVPEVHDVFGSDEHAVGLYTITARRGGSTLSWRHLNLYLIRDQQVVEVWQNPFDQALVDAFFA
jgi:ketosteroid isomerase-like protein